LHSQHDASRKMTTTLLKKEKRAAANWARERIRESDTWGIQAKKETKKGIKISSGHPREKCQFRTRKHGFIHLIEKKKPQDAGSREAWGN